MASFSTDDLLKVLQRIEDAVMSIADPTLAGDVTGTAQANTVVKVHGQAWSANAPGSKQIPIWDASKSQWAPDTAGNAGALMQAQNLGELTDKAAARANLELGSGISDTVALAKLTGGGANGSLTVVNGIITGYTAPT